MKFLQRKGGSQQEKALKESNIGKFRQAIQKANEAGGGRVHIARGFTPKGSKSELGMVSVQDVIEDPNFLETVRKKYKGGYFRFQLYNLDDEPYPGDIYEHHFSLADVETKKKKDDDGEDKKSKKTTDMVLEKLLDAVLVNKSNNSDVLTTKDLMEMQRSMMEMQQKSFEMMSAMSGGGGNGQFEGFLQGVDFYRQIAPQMEKEEPLTALALGGLNMLSQFVGRGSPTATGQQRVPSPGEARQLKQYAEKILAGELQEHPQAPGESTRGPAVAPPQALGTPGVQPAIIAGEPRPESPTAGQREAAFYVSFIEPFRAACLGEPDALDLAEKILIMYNYTRQFMLESPHPLMADFMSAQTITDFQNAFINFCATIPELRENKALQAEIANFLAPVIERMLQEGQEGQENVTEADTTVIGTDVETGSEHEDITTGESIDPEVEHEDVPGGVG